MLRMIKYFILCMNSIIVFIQDQDKLYGSELIRSDVIEDCYVELTGTVTSANYIRDASVTIYRDSTFYLSGKTNRSGKCKIKLPLNERYTIVFSKPGFVSKKISINTRIPVSKKGIYKFFYTVYLFEEIQGLDISILNLPVAIVTFNNFMNQFDYDYNYTVWINKDIEKLYDDYYLLEASQTHTSRNKTNAKKKTD